MEANRQIKNAGRSVGTRLPNRLQCHEIVCALLVLETLTVGCIFFPFGLSETFELHPSEPRVFESSSLHTL